MKLLLTSKQANYMKSRNSESWLNCITGFLQWIVIDIRYVTIPDYSFCEFKRKLQDLNKHEATPTIHARFPVSVLIVTFNLPRWLFQQWLVERRHSSRARRYQRAPRQWPARLKSTSTLFLLTRQERLKSQTANMFFRRLKFYLFFITKYFIQHFKSS